VRKLTTEEGKMIRRRKKKGKASLLKLIHEEIK